MSRKLIFRWYKKFQDGANELKCSPRPGQSEIDVTNANIAAMAGLNIKTPDLQSKILLTALAYHLGQFIRFRLRELKLRKVYARYARIYMSIILDIFKVKK